MTKKLSYVCLVVVLFIAMTAFTNVYSQKTVKHKHRTYAIDKESLSAKWKDGEEEYTFDKNGTSIVRINGRECPGTWELNGKTLIINPKKLMYRKDDPCSKTKVLEVKSYGPEGLQLTEKESSKELHLTKQK